MLDPSPDPVPSNGTDPALYPGDFRFGAHALAGAAAPTRFVWQPSGTCTLSPALVGEAHLVAPGCASAVTFSVLVHG